MYLPQYCIKKKKKKEVLTESMTHSFLFYHCGFFFFLFSKFSQKLIPPSHVNLDGGILHYAAAAAIYSGGESSLAFGVTWMMHDSGRSWDTETVICSNAATLPHLISVQLHHPGPSPPGTGASPSRRAEMLTHMIMQKPDVSSQSYRRLCVPLSSAVVF